MVTSTSDINNYHNIISNGKMMTESDAPPEKGGLSMGFRPHELLEAALASCINITIRMKASENGFHLPEFKVNVTVNKSIPGKSIFEYGIVFSKDIPLDQKELLINELDNCAVRKTLSNQLEFRNILL